MKIQMESNQISTTLKWTGIIFFVNTVVWLVFGVLSISLRALDEGSLTRWVISILMLTNGFVMIWFGVMIAIGHPRIFTLAAVYVGLNVVLSITDQFGWIDAIILFLNLCLLAFLLVARHRMNRTIDVPPRES
jgi:hypothetical protein